MSSLHRVKVLGRDVQVRSTASSELVREVEALVNTTVAQVQDATRTTDVQIVAILTLLNLAESLLVQSQEFKQESQMATVRIREMVQRMDEAMKRSS